MKGRYPGRRFPAFMAGSRRLGHRNRNCRQPIPHLHQQAQRDRQNCALNGACHGVRGVAVWFWMALAVIGGCRPTVLGGVDSRVS